MDPIVLSDSPPITLADLLSNALVLRQTAPYLPVSTLCSLLRTSRTLHRILLQSPETFCYLDLSTVKSAVAPFDGALHADGVRQRSEHVDEALSEDEYYSGPLRSIFFKLEQVHCLRNVCTMVLDGLSVTAELVRELLVDEKYNVRILSIREIRNLNERRLQQYLRYSVRLSRPSNTPRVKGLYIFGPRNPMPPTQSKGSMDLSTSTSRGIMSSQGAQIGAEWNRKSSDALGAALAQTEDKWYLPSGRMMHKRPSPEWAEVLQACEGIIAFDAVLCRGPRHDPGKAYVRQGTSTGHLHPTLFLRPAIATVALGPSGCESCQSCPEKPAIFGHSASSELPLLSPVPLHGSSLRAAQIPHLEHGSVDPPLYVRCEDCLKGRWCEVCNKWWDEDCYAAPVNAQRTEVQQTELMGSMQAYGISPFMPKQTIKVHMGLCVANCLVSEMMAGAGSNGMWG